MLALVLGLQMTHAGPAEASPGAALTNSATDDHSPHGDGINQEQPAPDTCTEPACGACLAFVDGAPDTIVFAGRELALPVAGAGPDNGTEPLYRPPIRSI